MMPKIETKEDYERAIDELDNIELDTYAKVVRKGVLNDAIAEYEENQKQLPDLSFITEYKEMHNVINFDGFSNKLPITKENKKKENLFYEVMCRMPEILSCLIKAAESDPEAAQLLKDIANVNK